MASLLEQIRHQMLQGLPFVAYHKPGSELVEAFFQKNRALNLSPDLLGSGFVFAPFDQGDTVLFSSEDCQRLEMRYHNLQQDGFVEKGRLAGEGVDITAQKKHLDLVERAIGHIKQGKAMKLVVSRKEETLAPDDLIAVFQRLLGSYPRAFTYLWFHPEIGTWMGASPEILLQSTGKSFRTIALAGTMVDDGAPESIWGKKEQEEQKMVTDHIRKELKGIDLQVGTTRTVKAGDLLHLRTDLYGELSAETSLSEVVRKLHPTAAVCGLPREEARSFLLEQEEYQREYYTGFLGELRLGDESSKKTEKPKRSLLFVNLRCMKINPEKKCATLYVGGGVTASSLPDKEWEETVAKSHTMKKVLRET